MTSVSAGDIILTPTQPVGSGRPQQGSNPGPPYNNANPTSSLVSCSCAQRRSNLRTASRFLCFSRCEMSFSAQISGIFYRYVETNLRLRCAYHSMSMPKLYYLYHICFLYIPLYTRRYSIQSVHGTTHSHNVGCIG